LSEEIKSGTLSAELTNFPRPAAFVPIDWFRRRGSVGDSLRTRVGVDNVEEELKMLFTLAESDVSVGKEDE